MTRTLKEIDEALARLERLTRETNGLSGIQVLPGVVRINQPLEVSSTTLVTNLNADTVDGYHAAARQALTDTTPTWTNLTGTRDINRLSWGRFGPLQVFAWIIHTTSDNVATGAYTTIPTGAANPYNTDYLMPLYNVSAGTIPGWCLVRQGIIYIPNTTISNGQYAEFHAAYWTDSWT